MFERTGNDAFLLNRPKKLMASANFGYAGISQPVLLFVDKHSMIDFNLHLFFRKQTQIAVVNTFNIATAAKVEAYRIVKNTLCNRERNRINISTKNLVSTTIIKKF